jgi:hypothetical protein
MWTTIKRKWKLFGDFMSEVVTRIIFSILFVVVFAPVAIVLKLMGKRFLPQFKSTDTTFYLPKEKLPPSLEVMKRQG